MAPRAMVSHLCLKSHQLFVIMLRVTLEMSTASWQGLKRSSSCLWWSPNILLLTGSKNKACFPGAEYLPVPTGRYFQAALLVAGIPGSSRDSCFLPSPSQITAYLGQRGTRDLARSFWFNKEINWWLRIDLFLRERHTYQSVWYFPEVIGIDILLDKKKLPDSRHARTLFCQEFYYSLILRFLLHLK